MFYICFVLFLFLYLFYFVFFYIDDVIIIYMEHPRHTPHHSDVFAALLAALCPFFLTCWIDLNSGRDLLRSIKTLRVLSVLSSSTHIISCASGSVLNLNKQRFLKILLYIFLIQDHILSTYDDAGHPVLHCTAFEDLKMDAINCVCDSLLKHEKDFK